MRPGRRTKAVAPFLTATLRLTLGLLFAAFLPALSASCTANLLAGRPRLEATGRPSESAAIGRVARVQFRSSNGASPTNRRLRSLKNALRYALLNSNRFSRVRFRESPGLHPAGHTTDFEFKIRAEEDGNFDWRISWPAVYPMTLYWPLQMKSGKVKVTLEADAYRGSQKVFSKAFSAEREYAITFYGFFRTSPIERESRAALEEALEALTRAVSQVDFEKAP